MRAKRRRFESSSCDDCSPPAKRPSPRPPYRSAPSVVRWIDSVVGMPPPPADVPPPPPSTRASSTQGSRSSSPSRPRPDCAYRLENLDAANISIATAWDDVPETLQIELDRLLTASAVDAARLVDAAAEYHRASRELEARSAGETNWQDAVKFMVKDVIRACAWNTLVMVSDRDWIPELKPPTRVYSVPALVPQKRRATSDGGMPTPTPSQPTVTTVTYRLKSPRPDICIALAHASFTQPAQRTLKALQATGTLISDPHPRGQSARFPFLVVEAKSPATLGNIFEAQNQAATSGACALNIQRNLAVLASEGPDRPFFFSMCTQGPMHEIWAHFWSPDQNPSPDSPSPGSFQMTRLASYDTGGRCGLEGAKQLARAVAAILHWGSGDFAQRLSKSLDALEIRLQAAEVARAAVAEQTVADAQHTVADTDAAVS